MEKTKRLGAIERIEREHRKGRPFMIIDNSPATKNAQSNWKKKTKNKLVRGIPLSKSKWVILFVDNIIKEEK